MTDEWFRIAVAAGVLMAALAFVVQAIIVIALYRSFRKTQAKVRELAEGAGPIIQKFGPLMDKAAPTLERAGPMLERASATLEKVGPVLEKSGPMMASIEKTAARAEVLLATVNRIAEENRPRVAEVSGEVAEIARSGRLQVEKLGEFLTDAGERARTRLEQIDDTVSTTVQQVEVAGETVKKAVMRPVIEVNGLAAGISAVVSTLVKGRKSSVASATQDEEMFI